jgi:hypothetical protein
MAVRPSSRPCSSTILPSMTFRTVAGEVHLSAGRGRQAADEEVVEGRTRMRAAAFPLADDIVALGDQVGGAPEVEVGECSPEVGHERLDVGAAAPGFVKGILEQHVWRRDLIDTGACT